MAKITDSGWQRKALPSGREVDSRTVEITSTIPIAQMLEMADETIQRLQQLGIMDEKP